MALPSAATDVSPTRGNALKGGPFLWVGFMYEYRHERTQLTDYARRKGPSALERYKVEKNRKSIDGIDGLVKHRPEPPP
jgi:hypothetical protein